MVTERSGRDGTKNDDWQQFGTVPEVERSAPHLFKVRTAVDFITRGREWTKHLSLSQKIVFCLVTSYVFVSARCLRDF